MNRQGFIGGSDLYSILNGDWYDLWEVKTGRKESDDLSDVFPVQLGIQTEEFHLDWFDKVSNYNVIHRQPSVTKEHNGIKLKGTFDGICETGEVVECKHTSGFKKMDDMIQRYLGQLHMYMYLSDTTEIVFSVIFGNRYEFCRVSFNKVYWEKCLLEIETFWEFVVADVAPHNHIKESFDWSQVEIDGLKRRDASQDNQFIDLAHEYVRCSNLMKEGEEVKKSIKKLVGDDEREVFCDLLTIKRDKRGALRITVKEK